MFRSTYSARETDHKPLVAKVKDISQIKPMLGQGRAGLRCKIKIETYKAIAQTVQKPLKTP